MCVNKCILGYSEQDQFWVYYEKLKNVDPFILVARFCLQYKPELKRNVLHCLRSYERRGVGKFLETMLDGGFLEDFWCWECFCWKVGRKVATL